MPRQAARGRARKSNVGAEKGMTIRETGSLGRFGKRLAVSFGRGLLDSLLPPRCLGCSKETLASVSLCLDCWSQLSFISRPHCAHCGLPFELEAEPGALCGECLRRPPPYRRGRAALRYDEGSRRLILRFKHADRTESARLFAGWLGLAGAELLEEADILVPVPLHWRRLLARRYNQAALLSQGLARRSGLPCVPDLLQRRRATASQGRKSRSQRQRNVAGAFRVNPKRASAIQGRRVLLIDDVFTTGATLEACTRTLLRAGAGGVDVLVLARVVR
jgi:ComF family protein